MARPNLTRYYPSPTHRAAIRASGFDLKTTLTDVIPCILPLLIASVPESGITKGHGVVYC